MREEKNRILWSGEDWKLTQKVLRRKRIHGDHSSLEQAASEVTAAATVKGSGQSSTALDGPLFIQLTLWKEL